MYSSNGTAFSVRDFRSALNVFCTRTLGTYTDFFNGSLGTSGWDVNNSEVMALQHNQSQAVYLFDFAPSDTTFYGDPGETTIIGQLLASFEAGKVTDFPSIQDPEEAIGQVIQGPFDAANALEVTLSSGVYTLTDTYAQADSTVDGLFLGLTEGQGVYIRDETDADLYHIIRVDSINVEGDVVTGVQVGALDAGVVSSDLLTAHSSNQGRVSKILFPVELDTDKTVTPFGSFITSMWEEDIDLADMQDGYFPRSTRLDFPNGVNYWMYGNNDPGDDYCYVILQNSSGGLSHWWMGRLTGTHPGLLDANIATGMFLGTSGPFTESDGSDVYQYPFSFGDANSSSKNPSILVAPVANTNNLYRYQDHENYTGSFEYGVNFSTGSQEEWTGTDATISILPESLQIDPTGTNGLIRNIGLSVDASLANTVRFAIRKTADGDAGLTGQIRYLTDVNPTYVGHSVDWDATNIDADLGNWWVIAVDMTGAADWADTVTAIRIDFPSETVGGDVYEISWIRIDDGDETLRSGVTRVIEQPFGGSQTYGPTGSGHDARFGVSTSDFKTLKSDTYSIQAGLNGFNGALCHGMMTFRDRTFHALRRNGAETALGLSPNDAQYIGRFTGVHAILYECPFGSVRDARLTPTGGDTEEQANIRYMNDISFYTYLGQFPSVYRGTILENETPRSTSFAGRVIDQFPVTVASLFSGLQHPEQPTDTSSGKSSYFYVR